MIFKCFYTSLRAERSANLIPRGPEYAVAVVNNQMFLKWFSMFYMCWQTVCSCHCVINSKMIKFAFAIISAGSLCLFIVSFCLVMFVCCLFVVCLLCFCCFFDVFCCSTCVLVCFYRFLYVVWLFVVSAKANIMFELISYICNDFCKQFWN